MKLTIRRKRGLLPILALTITGAASSVNADPQRLHSDYGMTAQKDSHFGAQMDIDGNIAVIGAPNWVRLGQIKGAAYVLEKGDDGLWHYTNSLYSPNPEHYGQFGLSVGVSGDQIIVGAYGESTGGHAYIFTRKGPGDWSNGVQLPGTPNTLANFGISVAIEGDFALVGAPNNTVGLWNGSTILFRNCGGAQLFKKVGDNWEYNYHLKPPISTAQDNQEYGRAVTLTKAHGKVYAICGSPYYDFITAEDSGYCEFWELDESAVPERITTRWSIVAFTRAGYSLAADGPYVAVGVNGLDNGTIWTYELLDESPFVAGMETISSPYLASEGEDFGETLGLFDDKEHGPMLVAGLYNGDAGAYVYRWDEESSQYDHQDVITTPAGHEFDQVYSTGRYVAVSGDEIFVGAYSARKSSDWGYPAIWSFGTDCPYTEFKGYDKGDQTGASLVEVGDLDGDYVNDYAVGSPRNDFMGSNAGKVTIYSGDSCNEVIMTLYGEQAKDRFGHAVAKAGDLNNDGIKDFLVGAPHNSEKAKKAGKAYAFSGADGSLLWSRTGPSAGDEFGYAIAGGRYLSGAQAPDIVVGAPKNDKGGDNAGMVRVYDGQSGGKILELTGEQAGEQFGYAVAILGKGNSDNLDELIVGAPKNDEAGSSAGKITVFKGKKWTKWYSLTGENAGDHFGSAIAGLGVLNGDSRNDFVVGAPRFSTSSKSKCGRIYAIRGDTGDELFSKTGGMKNARLGQAVAIGAENCWSSDNIVIAGAPRWNDRQGRVRMWHETGTSYDTMEGPAPNSDYGAAITSVNGGFFSGPSVAVGAPRRSSKAGSVDRTAFAKCHIMLSTLPKAKTESESEYYSAELQLGDLNHDGVLDLHDMLGVLDRMGTTDELADMNYDGLIDSKDVVEILKDM